MPRQFHGFFSSIVFALPAFCCLILSACVPSQSGSHGTAATPGFSARQLAYGVSIAAPDGWVVENSILPEAADRAALDARVDRGERVLLFSMYHPAPGPEGKNAIVALFLVDASRNFPPEDRAAQLTPDDLERYGQAILARDREAAARNNSESNLLSWEVSRARIDNKFALVHHGTARGPNGTLNLHDVNMYLPGGKGLALKSMSDASAPAAGQPINTVVNSLRAQ
jgi:hypothetical protein